MNLHAISGYGPAEQVDRHITGLDRHLVGLWPKLQQVGKVALELRNFRTDGRYQRLCVRTAALEAADGCANDRESRFEILPDRREERRADPVVFANASEIPCFRLQ